MIVGLVQARMGSTRFPGKVLQPLLGRPMLEVQLERLRACNSLDNLAVATTQELQDDPIAELVSSLGIEVFRGSTEDVLDRLYRAAASLEPRLVVRLTGDCPLVDPTTVDRCVEMMARSDSYDYVATGPTFPEGDDVEVLTFRALEEAWRSARHGYEREHVTVYVWQSGRFRVHLLQNERDLSHLRWTVDEQNDYELVHEICRILVPKQGWAFSSADIAKLIEERPELRRFNSNVRRNAGFLESSRTERSAMIKRRTGGLAESERWWARAQGLIPAGTQTLSKGPTQYVNGVAPKYLDRAEGSHTWDVDGNEYVDYAMGLGSVVLGHAHPTVNDAVKRHLDAGQSLSLMHPLEVEVAELLADTIPCAEMVRFGKNGSDVTGGAVRVARAFTGREKVAHCGYHGWLDWYVGSTSRRKGVPQADIDLQFPFRYNDLESLDRVLDAHTAEIAAVIMEPYGMIDPDPGFLEGVAERARKHGAVLIFDEVATGFRFEVGGIHQRFGVVPDLACFGKAMGNGIPVSALVGKREVMQVLEEVFFSFTFAGETMGLAAAKATLTKLLEDDVVGYMGEVGSRLKAGIDRLLWDYGLHDLVSCVGLPQRTFLLFKDSEEVSGLAIKSLLQQELLKRGVIALTTGHNISYSHSEEDVEWTLGAYEEALEVLTACMKTGEVDSALEGEPVEPVFRPVN